MADDINVATMMSAYEDARDKSRVIAQELADIEAKRYEIEQRSAEANRQNAEDAGALTRTVGEAMLSAQNLTQIAVKKMQGDVSDPTSLKAQSMEEFVARSREAKDQLEEIKQIQSKGFFDDPLGYIVGQMDLPNKVQGYNITATQANSALSVVNHINSTLTAEAAENKATALVLTNDSIAQESRIAANKYTQIASDYEYKALGSQADAVKAVNTGNVQAMHFLEKEYKVLTDDVSDQARKEELKMHRLRFDEFMQGKEDARKKADYFKSQIELGAATLNLRRPDGTELANLGELYKNNPKDPRVNALLNAAMRTSVNGFPSLGSSPGETFYSVAATADTSKDKEYRPLMEMIKNEAQLLAHPTRADQKPIDPKHREVFEPALNDAANSTLRKSDANPEGSKLSQAPTMERMAQVDYVRETPWFKEIVAPSLLAAKQSGVVAPRITAENMFNQTVDAINSGKLSIEQGYQGLSSYYNAATHINNIQRLAVGARPQVDEKGKPLYPVNLGAFSDRINMADPVMVNNAILGSFTRQLKGLFSNQGNISDEIPGVPL